MFITPIVPWLPLSPSGVMGVTAHLRARNAGLIVLVARKTRLFGAFVRRFEEGTAYSVAARAHCPVLTVRQP